MKALPVAGGVLDQPLAVRLAWPVLEHEFEPFERNRKSENSQAALVAALGAMFGKRIRR